MKTKDVPVFKQKVLDMLPITQAEIWKTLRIGQRDASDLISIMIDENLIKKRRLNRTFMLERMNGSGKKKMGNKKKIGFAVLLSNDDQFSPCCNCRLDCEPSTCILLDKWLI